MFRIIDKDKIIYFTYQKDADNYLDFMKNGLKIIRVSGRTYYFNNGDKLINVSLRGEKEQRYVLHTRTSRTVKSERLQRKHVECVKKLLEKRN